MRRDASPAAPHYERLRRRADFVAAGKGRRSSIDACGVQTCLRAGADDAAARFGITVTKKTAPRAVDRNRIRRRLREALRLGSALSGTAGHDYVIVGRRPLLTIEFDELQRVLARQVSVATQKSATRRSTDTTRQGR